jgi:hypothetical protein
MAGAVLNLLLIPAMSWENFAPRKSFGTESFRREGKMRRLLLVVLGVVCLSGTAWGQATSPPPDQSEVVKALLERIDKLEKRLSEVEGKLACAPGPCEPKTQATAPAEPAPPPSTVAASQTPASPMGHDHGATGAEQPSFPSMQIRGFGDVDFSATNQPGTTSGFNLGQFVLHIASPLSRKVTYFGEVSFTAQPTGYNLEVERTVIRYDYNDNFKLSFGKYHTPINYWNTAFHHGLWLQTTISRPEMVQFGGRFLPVHFVGLLGEGEIPSGPVGLNYQVGMGNGRFSNIARAGDSGDINDNRAWVVNLFAKPPRIYGLQLGGSLYGDQITSGLLPRTQELITSVHLIWVRETPEFLAEFSNVHHRVAQTGQTFNSQGYYIQLAYRLPWNDKKWKPYFRFEHMHIPAGEPVLQVPNLVESTLGIRYDITEFAAFKTEYRNFERGTQQPHFNGVFLQTSFTF